MANAARSKATDGDLPIRDFADSLPMALLKAREAVMSRFRPMLRRYGVTEQQWRVLRALVETDEIEVSQLAADSCILMPSLSRILQNLEARDLIDRSPVISDQRRAVIAITNKGRELVSQVAPHSEDNYDAIARAVGAENIESLYRLLNDLTTSLDEDAEL